MSYQIDKKEKTITISGWENGIGMSPHKGLANIQAGNISTISGEAMASFDRALQTTVKATGAGTGTLTATSTTELEAVMTGVSVFNSGVPITISGSSIIGLADGTYYIVNVSSNVLKLSTTLGGSVETFTASGTASFTYTRDVGKPIAKATEFYSDGTNKQYRYYILDNQGLVWVYDTATVDASINLTWFLPDTTLYTNATGLAILNGWVMLFANHTSPATARTIWCKSTSILTSSYTVFASGLLLTPASSPNKNFAFVGHQGKLYYTDTNFIGSLFPNTSLLSGGPNIQSYCKYTAVTTTGTIATLISGSLPTVGTSTLRIPAVFFTDDTKPTALTVGTVYYIEYAAGTGKFGVYAAISGGSALDIATGSSGNQYFNTFYPISAGGKATLTWTPQRLDLPTFEIATVIGEIGNNVIIGCESNILYPWNQVSVTPSDIIPLPENMAVNMVTVNNMLYVFAGNKGNIYVTNGSTASLVLTVPDYCAGIAGSPQTYIDPYFTWGDAMYLRGRVYFSIQDQVAAKSPFPAKAGNCGGVWSFVPSQNFFYGQDTGLSLRIENQNSYGSYNGAASVLIPSETQTERGPQYFSGWYSDVSSPLYGIDGNDQTISTPCVIETDLIPTGSMLDKHTFSRIEYKLSTILSVGTVTMKYRQNSTDAWVTCGTAVTETSPLSGYFSSVFEKGQWLQLQITLSPNGSGANADFVRLQSIKII